MSFSTLHVILILTLAILVSIHNPGNYCFRNCAFQIIAHIPSLREYILDDKNTGVYTGLVHTVLRQMLKSQCVITVPLALFLVDEDFYKYYCGGDREHNVALYGQPVSLSHIVRICLAIAHEQMTIPNISRHCWTCS
jgi:hypothetical protein